MTESINRTGDADPEKSWLGYMAGVVFFVIAAYMFFTGSKVDVPHAQSPAITAEDISVEPRRKMLGNPPLVKIGGFDRTCQDCHQHFKSGAPVSDEQRKQHQGLVLQHGMNDGCYNCHNNEDRNMLNLHNNYTVTFDKSEMLCAQCHGTTYRDWRDGMHGKTIGAWDDTIQKDGARLQRRLKCVECHDPHHPAYGKIKPLPGPNTLRMGDQSQQHHTYESPIMKWQNELEGNAHDHEEGHADEGGH